MKFSALNVSLNFLGSSKPAHEGIKERYPRKSTSDELFNHINIDDEMAGDRLMVCEQELL